MEFKGHFELPATSTENYCMLHIEAEGIAFQLPVACEFLQVIKETVDRGKEEANEQKDE